MPVQSLKTYFFIFYCITSWWFVGFMFLSDQCYLRCNIVNLDAFINMEISCDSATFLLGIYFRGSSSLDAMILIT